MVPSALSTRCGPACSQGIPAPDVYTFHAARTLLPPELSAAIVGESRLAALPGVRQRGQIRAAGATSFL